MIRIFLFHFLCGFAAGLSLMTLCVALAYLASLK